MHDVAPQKNYRWFLIIALALLGLPIALVACRNPVDDQGNQELIVFAAASLAEAFTELAQQFEAQNENVGIILNFASSQQLAHQLSQGAPADVFASANERQMAAVIDTGRITSSSQRTFANNRLVIIYPVGNPAELATIADLARPGNRLILAAAEVPAGEYAQDFLQAAANDPTFGPGFRQGVLDNVVSYEENVRAVLSKIRLGEADAGIVYESDVQAEISGEVKQIEIPADLNIVADYPIAPIVNSPRPDLAQAFIDFVLSPAGQQIMADHGFTPVTMP